MRAIVRFESEVALVSGVVAAVGAIIYLIAHTKVKGSGHSFRDIAAQVPIE